jgi:hypothetical protein
MKGRNSNQESRAQEFRQRLLVWKQIPESARPSLRELACQLGTSHQLLKHYLGGLEKWQCKERYAKAKRAVEEIRARAVAEDRPLTAYEEQQVRAWDREAMRALVLPTLLKNLEEIKRDAKRGPLHRLQFKLLESYAKNGFPGAQELLDKRAEIGVKPKSSFAKIVRVTPRRESEVFSDWVHRIWAECEKYETDTPAVVTEELLEKYSQRIDKRRIEILPVALDENAKSFKSVEATTGNSAKAEGRRTDAII